GPCRVDAGDGEDRAVAVRAGQSAQVSDVVRAARLEVRSCVVRRAGTPVHQRPGLTLRVFPGESRVLGIQVTHSLGHTRTADDDQAVTVEADLPAHLHVAGADVEAVRLPQRLQPLAGAHDGHVNDRTVRRLVRPPRRPYDFAPPASRLPEFPSAMATTGRFFASSHRRGVTTVTAPVPRKAPSGAGPVCRI